uniref:CA domain-containing protein n=1 Tax=Echinostoma caproni TaxID=27848 RepID=A0A183A2X9_9TREM
LADSKELRTNQERGASATMESGQDWVREANGAVQRTQSPIHMSLHEKPGYLITTLQATDPDKDENAQIVYRVEELRRALGNITKPSGARTANLIRIDPSLGHIVLTRELDESDLGVHLIRVSASDRGLPNPRNVSKVRDHFAYTDTLDFLQNWLPYGLFHLGESWLISSLRFLAIS